MSLTPKARKVYIALAGRVCAIAAFSWVIMLALGDLHDQWSSIPAWSYLTTFCITSGATCVATLIKLVR